MFDNSPLDNPTWHALIGEQADFALGSGLARRFRPDVASFAALIDNSAQAWDDLAALVEPGSDVVLNRLTPATGSTFRPPPGWTLLGGGEGFQMVLDGEVPDGEVPDGPPSTIRDLTDADVDEMVALVRLTEPGPFCARTIELGGFRGIFDDGRLMAMAGQRVAFDGYTEVSAVCTHPDGRRRGYAAAVTSAVARGIRAEGRTAILHVAEHNTGAKRVYDQLGFVTRTMLTFAAFRAPG